MSTRYIAFLKRTRNPKIVIRQAVFGYPAFAARVFLQLFDSGYRRNVRAIPFWTGRVLRRLSS